LQSLANELEAMNAGNVNGRHERPFATFLRVIIFSSFHRHLITKQLSTVCWRKVAEYIILEFCLIGDREKTKLLFVYV